MFQPIRGQGGHLVFPICPKNTKLVEDVEIFFFHKRYRANRRAMALLPASAMARLSHEGLGSTVKGSNLGMIFPNGNHNTKRDFTKMFTPF